MFWGIAGPVLLVLGLFAVAVLGGASMHSRALEQEEDARLEIH